MNIKELKDSIIADIIDVEFTIKKSKEEFVRTDINPHEHLNHRIHMNAYKLALETILNRIETKL